MFKKLVVGVLLLCSFGITGMAQDKTIDQIVAVVGSNIILKSDIENMYRNNQAQGITSSGDPKCEILENFLVQKLLLAEAELDTTIIVSDSQLNQNLDQRIQYFIKNLGSQKAVENYFKKPIAQIKSDMEDVVRDQLMTNQMRNKIEGDVSITPAEVRYKYRNTPQSKLPMVQPQIEYEQISVIPPISLEEENAIKARLRNFKKRIENGENFSTLAVLYSEGPSAANGGELGYLGRAQLDPAYAAAAFSLRKNQVSNVVKSEFGYHIIQMIGRRGQEINTRHILLRPKPTEKAIAKTEEQLDSLASAIRKNKISFEEAALRFSQDKNSRNSGGVALNPATMSSKWTKEELDPEASKILSKLKVNEISEPFKSIDNKQRTVYKIVKLIKRTPEHWANLTDDYQTLHDRFLEQKKKEALDNWVSKQQSKTYIHIDDTYTNCNFKFKGWIK